MKIVFVGTVDFSYTILSKLISLNANIFGVCTKKVQISIVIIKISFM